MHIENITEDRNRQFKAIDEDLMYFQKLIAQTEKKKGFKNVHVDLDLNINKYM